jgi:hypothetical protein
LNKAYTPQMTNGSTMNARGLLGPLDAGHATDLRIRLLAMGNS